MRILVSSALVLAGWACWSGVAHGQAPDYEKAKIHYQNAETAMQEARYAGAAAEYIVAYEITQDAVLFYKIATAYEQAGDCPKALVYYRRYLAQGKPDEALRATVDERIAACGATTRSGAEPAPVTAPREATPRAPDAAAGAGSTPSASPAADDPTFLAAQPSWQRSTGWVLVGATVALATTGAILAMSGGSRQEDLEGLADFRDAGGNPATYDGNVRERYDELVAEGGDFNTWAAVAFGAAGVAAVASATLLVLDARRTGESGTVITRVRPVLGADGAGIAAIVRF